MLLPPEDDGKYISVVLSYQVIQSRTLVQSEEGVSGCQEFGAGAAGGASCA